MIHPTYTTEHQAHIYVVHFIVPDITYLRCRHPCTLVCEPDLYMRQACITIQADRILPIFRLVR